jgi:hypothetical protein
MELKRNYKDTEDKPELNNPLMRRFSLTGLYYYLFLYGESLKKALFCPYIAFFLCCPCHIGL